MSLLDRFDFFDPEVMNNPYPYFAEMREKAPLFWNERLQAHILSRYEDVTYVLKNPALFSSVDIRVAGKLPKERTQITELGSVSNLVTSDPPNHTRLRGLVSRAFIPKRISELEPRVRELSRGLVAEMTARDEFDFMDGLASPLPVTVISEMLGIETSRRRDFKRWSDSLITAGSEILRTGKQSEESIRSAKEMLAYMTEIAEKRRQDPKGDLISLLVQESDGVAALTPQEVNSFAIVLLIAGNETTTNLLGNALVSLIRNPEQYEWLRRNPTLQACAAVAEETLRYDSPVLGLMRRVTQDVELAGGKLPADSTVMVLMASANHDPRKFANPERFDPQRDTTGLLSFGHGIHFCLGAPLSRLEAPVALQELMERAPKLGFAPRQPERIDYGSSFFLRGPRSLWLRKN
ncbi:cytochrome P450 [Archangium violaceum]|uniref:cytochrome P450 n=1 Tax=Archangium violaceum TaxID=83451 RepID=UPI00194F0CE3|nr:cytochrome P450 [Archangium violaceum]QRN92808.1 cytochrome P450 [Archangium violaceum]